MEDRTCAGCGHIIPKNRVTTSQGWGRTGNLTRPWGELMRCKKEGCNKPVHDVQCLGKHDCHAHPETSSQK